MNVHDSERLSGSLESAGYVRAEARRRGRRRRHQHVRRPRQRRRQAVRHARPPEVPQGQARGHADRRRRLPRADGQGRRARQGAVGRCRLRHAQHGVAPEPARAGSPQRRGRARDPRVARDLPVHAAHQARLGLQRLGVDLGRLQQHLHVLHRAEPARQREGPPARRHPERDPPARRRRRDRGDPARSERQLLRRRVRRPAGVRQAAARRRRDRRTRAHPLHQPAPGGVHRRRHRRDGRDARP